MIRITTKIVAVCARIDKGRLPKKIITYGPKIRKKSKRLEYKME